MCSYLVNFFRGPVRDRGLRRALLPVRVHRAAQGATPPEDGAEEVPEGKNHHAKIALSVFFHGNSVT